MVPHEGSALVLGGREFIVPALNFKQLKTLLPRLNRLQAGDAALDGEQLDIVLDLVMAALNRNYPDLAREEVEERLTIADMPGAITAVLLGSGFARMVPPPGE